MKLKPKQRGLVKNILTIAIPLLSTIALYYGLQIALATDSPFVAVVGGSMSPVLEDGDLVIVQGMLPTDVEVGEIIVFDSQQGGRTIHRVTRIQALPNGEIQFRTKGDANANEDLHWIPEQDVRGRVLYRIPYLGWLTLDPTIPISIVIIMIIISIIWPERSKRRGRARVSI